MVTVLVKVKQASYVVLVEVSAIKMLTMQQVINKHPIVAFVQPFTMASIQSRFLT